MWYKVGWYEAGKRQYVTVKSKEQMFELVDEKTCISDNVSVKCLAGFTLQEGEDDAED